MTASGLVVQLLNGLAEGSTMFLVAAGLSLIFGVTRIVNFAHGSFFMVGLYLAYTLTRVFSGPFGYWVAMLLAALFVAAIGAVVELVILRRVYRSPELFQLLATFALVLVMQDAVLFAWGPEDLFAARVPGLAESMTILGRRFPAYDLVLIAIGPIVLGALWLALKRTRWGLLVRAATQDRVMAGALGVDQRVLFTGVFALGCFLAGLGGALQAPRMPAHLSLDLEIIGNAFVVVVVGGMGSIPGAFVAAMLIAETKALCIAIGHFSIGDVVVPLSRLTLVIEFVVMAIVLTVRPWGLFGKPQPDARRAGPIQGPLRAPGARARYAIAVGLLLLAALPLASNAFPYALVIGIEMLIAVLFAVSLHFLMGPGGMHSFGHAAYFGLGAYGAALLATRAGLPMEIALVLAPFVALIGAVIFGWFSVRLSGIYLAMLTLAFAQIVWAILYQWDDLTGGSNGLVGVWPSPRFSSPGAYYLLVLIACASAVVVLWRMLFAPFGTALRASRDSPLRAEAIGIHVKRTQWVAFAIAGAFCGLAGALFAFSKGSISPEAASIGRSIDGLVMVLLGGIETLMGPVVGAALFTWLQDTLARDAPYWKALLGATMLALVLLFPAGVVGSMRALWDRLYARAAR